LAVEDDDVTHNIRPDLVEYVKLIDSFVNDHIATSEFERRYLRLVKDDTTIHGEPAFGIIDGLFFHVDEYFDDPDYTDHQRQQAVDNLRNHAREALVALTNVSN
jgi:hypothetical protein